MLRSTANEENLMREVPKSTLSDEALDKAKCREALEEALKAPERSQAFDRHAWLSKTKGQLKHHASAQ
jgi:hypothetical protein